MINKYQLDFTVENCVRFFKKVDFNWLLTLKLYANLLKSIGDCLPEVS